jgi:hypothetical protein
MSDLKDQPPTTLSVLNDPSFSELDKQINDSILPGGGNSTSSGSVPRLGTNPKDLLGIKKVRLGLVPPSSMIYQALAMEDGAKKYGPYNWRANKVISSVYLDAAIRHLLQYMDGEDLAEDSQKPHLGHALACIGIIVDAKETGNLIDDRPLRGAASKLIETWKKS